jgi:AGZA family xanthine/uracil permease-like MFS transporter
LDINRSPGESTPVLVRPSQPELMLASQTPTPPARRAPPGPTPASSHILNLPASLTEPSPSTQPREGLGPPKGDGSGLLHAGSSFSSTAMSPRRRRTVLLTWGQNSSGQLGMGDFSTRVAPQAVEYFRSATLASVACGSRTTLALDDDGKAFAWGKGEDGTLGIGDRSTAIKPTIIGGLLRHPMKQLMIRGAHVLALTERGQTWAWGRNEDGQLGTSTRKGAAAAAPEVLTQSAVPTRVAGLMGVHVTAVACGRCHSVALDVGGQLHSWGGNDDGALGHGDTVSRPSPTRVAALHEGGHKVFSVACGSRHTLALDDQGTLFSWGWGAYGQLGHGSVSGCLVPTEVEELDRLGLTLGPNSGCQLACGYRHSMVLVPKGGHPSPAEPGGQLLGASGAGGAIAPREVYAWGWGRHGQLGLGGWDDELLPKRVAALAPLGVLKLVLGGRHSLALCAGGRVYAWGRDDDGQLGLGAQGGRCVPTLLPLIPDPSLELRVLDAACGWAHTALLVSVTAAAGYPDPISPPRGKASRSRRRGPRLIVWADLEGLFGQVLGSSIQFMLVDRLVRSTCGFSAEMVARDVLPGATAVYVFGHAFFALQGKLLSDRTGEPATALPQGMNIVTFFAFSQLIMAPTYRGALRDGLSDADAARLAYDTGLCACVLLACLELVGVPFVDVLRRNIPRAAMLSAIAGVSLTFIAMGFAVQIFAAPATALVSMLLMLMFYGGGVKLPFKVPGGVLAVSVGWLLSVVSSELGYTFFMAEADGAPDASGGGGGGGSGGGSGGGDGGGGGGQLGYAIQAFVLPRLHWRFFAIFLTPGFWTHLSIVIPMWLVNMINNLANVEAASAVGEHYDQRTCLLGCALIDLSCALLGNPFPSCVYIGHASFKAMGCRIGYMVFNILPCIYFGCMRGAALLQRTVPIESGVGFLMWVGLTITAQGFEGDNTPEGWRHGPAVAIGLIPSIAAWSWQTVSTTYVATRGLLCDAMGEAARERTLYCDLELEEVMQGVSSPIAPEDSPLGSFQRNLSSLYLSGMFALANGYLLSAISLSSMLVYIIDGDFYRAALWLILLAAASSVGVVHSPTLDPRKANQLFPIMYLLAAVSACCISHPMRRVWPLTLPCAGRHL